MGFANSDAPPPSWVEVRPPVSAASDVESVSEARPSRRRRATGSSRSEKSGGRSLTPPPPDVVGEGSEPDAHDVARQIVLRQLTNSPKSRAQLEQALSKRDCDPEVAASVLDRLEEVGLVDDQAYAGMLVRSQQAGRGLARRALAQNLRHKGVAAEVVESVLDDIDPQDEEERARTLVHKRLRRLHGLDAVVQTRRLGGMLARKGYSSEVSLRVIREALAATPEHQRD